MLTPNDIFDPEELPSDEELSGILDEMEEKTRFPFYRKRLFECRFGECRFFQTPGDCDLSIGIDWTIGNTLAHIHILFWEIDFEFIPTEQPKEKFYPNLNIHKEDYYPFEADLDGRRIIRERLQQLAELGLEEVAPGQFGIPKVMSGLYIERVWHFSHKEFQDYVDWIKQVKKEKA